MQYSSPEFSGMDPMPLEPEPVDGVTFEAPDPCEFSLLRGVGFAKLPCSQANCFGVKGADSNGGTTGSGVVILRPLR